MWDYRVLRRLDFRTVPVILGLMSVSLLVISATSVDRLQGFRTGGGEPGFFTPLVKSQMRWFGLGIIAYLFFAGFDYGKLRVWSRIVYVASIIMLCGLFFTSSIHNVHRWYRIPFIGIAMQPSECAKFALILMLGSFLDGKSHVIATRKTALQALLLTLIPFVLIVRQPDLGSAFVLYPIASGIFYFAGIHRRILSYLVFFGVAIFSAISLLFLEIIPYDRIHPLASACLKPYQCERLNPATYHHQAGRTAIGLGKYTGSGFRRGRFTGRGFLPAASTDSVFPAFVEEFGVLGGSVILLLFFGLIYFSFRVTAVARDSFGRILAAGVAMYIAVHVVVNIGMMCGFLPITGVPLLLMTYGGSSVLWSMASLGLLQSVYVRRYMF
ncbi:MAG: FtsW/RodA/SpoVE family cell cycle protein [Simkaniaceae bacterium]|nr:FtsW/RodA/SpoVE family cell cycle protein [Simkaniaceae bacterium]